MNRNYIKELLNKHINSSITVEETSILANLLADVSDDELSDLINEITISEEDYPKISAEEISIRLDRVYTQVSSKIEIGSVPRANKSSVKTIRWVKYIAAACLLIMAGFFWLYYYNTKNQPAILSQKEILPAQAMASIAIGNGQVVQIDSSKTGLIFKEKGLEVYKNELGQIEYKSTDNSQTPEYLIVRTPKGGFSELKLSDGTVVSLNADSYIRYPLNFDGNKREVTAEGELLFKVASDKNRPFRVLSNKQQLEVLGTIFNLHSREGLDKTTLLEGRVKIKVKDKEYFLKPGQQALVSEDVAINDVLAREKVAWTEDRFVFHNSSFIDILKEIENWYDITFYFEEQLDMNIKMLGEVSRSIKLRELLDVLEMNCNYEFKIEERRVIVKNKTN